MEIDKADINSIIPYALNSRDHGSEQIDRIANSIADFGFNQPIVVDENNIIIVGHGRFAAAKKLGLAEVPIVRKADLTETQKKAYRILDNKLQNDSTWNFENLGLELSNLDDCDFDISTWGLEDLLELMPAQELEATEDDFEPVLEQPAYIKLGDIISLGEHRVMCGDSTKVKELARLMAGEKAQMLFTDPPYGVDYEGGHFHSGDVTIVRKREKLQSDSTADIYSAFLPLVAQFVNGPCYIWFASSKSFEVYTALTNNNYELHALLIWNKTNAKYAAMNAQYKQRHEPFIYCKPRGSTLRWCGATTEATVWDQARDGINEYHPTQKPVALAAKAIQNHEADSVLDLFLGSGTTLIAAEQLNRKCYGMEISPLYCQVIIDRYKTHCITANKPFICKINGEDFDSIRL
ncbi:COG0863 DNA modification methylase [uncultured Caudovirales phage]|uniref:COG0863 DNA modification methylase n=1 Tax=uncultured Caudovirales phage TaxID=2100421 RepID=A0A6J5T040_9CAUD|nr:COG0863 DNA modification methylase [uncultured Caudovirales phage]